MKVITLLAVVLSLVVTGVAHADFNVIVSVGQPNWGGCNNGGGRDFDRDRGRGRNDFDRPRFSVGFGQASCIGQTGVVNGVLCQLQQTQFGLQWVPLQQPSTGYYNSGYNGFGGGVVNDAYQRSYQQTLDQRRQEAFDRQLRDARQAGQRAAEQQFNAGYPPQPTYYAPAPQWTSPQPTYYTPAPTYGGGYQGWNCPSAR